MVQLYTCAEHLLNTFLQEMVFWAVWQWCWVVVWRWLGWGNCLIMNPFVELGIYMIKNQY